MLNPGLVVEAALKSSRPASAERACKIVPRWVTIPAHRGTPRLGRRNFPAAAAFLAKPHWNGLEALRVLGAVSMTQDTFPSASVLSSAEAFFRPVILSDDESV
jgi:hypothetical protein